jgi:Leucine-rich repeat (LRR) protein
MDNPLSVLDVSNNPELTELHCDDNRLTALALSGNPKLSQLLCRRNKIAGENMTALIAGLPDRSDKPGGYIELIDLSSSREQNEFNDAQKAMLAKKNWKGMPGDKTYETTK